MFFPLNVIPFKKQNPFKAKDAVIHQPFYTHLYSIIFHFHTPLLVIWAQWMKPKHCKNISCPDCKGVRLMLPHSLNFPSTCPDFGEWKSTQGAPIASYAICYPDSSNILQMIFISQILAFFLLTFYSSWDPPGCFPGAICFQLPFKAPCEEAHEVLQIRRFWATAKAEDIICDSLSPATRAFHSLPTCLHSQWYFYTSAIS